MQGNRRRAVAGNGSHGLVAFFDHFNPAFRAPAIREPFS
jgi:hypothetical protein